MTFLFQKASGTSQPPAALQSIKNFQPQAFCNLETLDSSHLNLGHPKPGSRGLGKAGQKAASRVQHHLLCPVPPPAAWLHSPTRAQSGLRASGSPVGPLGCEKSAGTHS
jgi:hypothetical protein